MNLTPLPDSYYIYCVVAGSVNEKFGRFGIGGRGDEVYGRPFKDVTAVVSRTNQNNFERNEENVLAHQRVLQKIFSRYIAIPLPFSTIVESESELESLMGTRHDEFHGKLEKLREIAQPVNLEPGSEVVEEALAQSFASALRIRQLSEELTRLGSVPTVEPQKDTLLRRHNDGRRPGAIALVRARAACKKHEYPRIFEMEKRSAGRKQLHKKSHGLLDPTRLPNCAALFPRYFSGKSESQSPS